MKSVWDEVKRPEFPSLTGDIKTDVLIIGGGAAGLLTAYFLQEKGVKCTLVEKDRILSGVTGNTTAKITAGHGFIYQKLYNGGGRELAGKYYRANTEAIGKYRELSKKIDCDFEIKDNYVYTLKDRKKAEAEQKVLETIGAKPEFCESTELPFKVDSAVKLPDQAQFNPAKFFYSITENLNIYENTHVLEMVGNTAVTSKGKINAKAVVVATHFPFINKHGGYFLKMYQYRSYVLALKNAQKVNGMYVDEREGGLSFRSYNDLLLFGGCGGHTGKPCGGWDELRKKAGIFYPDATEEYAWAAQDCVSLDDRPYIGRYSKCSKNLYVATGFRKWGMTGSMTAATLLSDMITGKRNEYADVFDPSRSMLHFQLLKNGCNSAANLLKISKKRCPHLGCALTWNKAEHSWDCPCHGSRFSENGELLNNPANGDLKK